MHLEESRDQLAAEARSRIEAVEQLRHSERVATLGQLSAGMAHELGTPLNVISGRAKLIATDPASSEELSESARIIAEQADRMTGIVRQFLEYGRRSGGQRAPEDLRQIVSHVLNLLDSSARKQDVSLHLVDGEAVPRAIVDRSGMQQVCMNLIRNAIQAMPEGGQVEVRVDRERVPLPSGAGDAVCAVLRVRDEGIGIPSDKLDRIFEPFFSTKSAGQGTGLGLAIVASIVEDHGGWLTVDSEPGRGSCFRVHLPAEDECSPVC
jgi:two-component system NtrC family sensor kinase